MITRLLALWLSGLLWTGLAQGQENSSEMPPETVTKVTDTLKKAALLKRKQFESIMHDEIDSLVKDAHIDDTAIGVLKRAAARAEDAAQDDFAAQCLQLFREAYARDGASSLDWIVKPGSGDLIAGPNGPTGSGVRFTGPLDQPAWKESVAQVLTPEQIAAWHKARADREAAVDKEISTYLDAQTDSWRERVEAPMQVQVQEITAGLSLPQERAAAVDALAKQAVNACLEGWRQTVRKSFLKTLAGKTPAQRAATLQGHGIYMKSMDADLPEKQKVWTDGLARLLTDPERARLQTVRASHKTRRTHAVAQLLVALMDEKTALTESQRLRLEPIMEKLALPRPEFFPAGTNGDYYSLRVDNFYKAAQAATPEELRPILDDLQRAHWQAAKPGPTSNDQDDEAQPSATSDATAEDASAPEPEDLEQTVSDYIRTCAASRYEGAEAVMLLQAEDATRVAGLEAPRAARLQTAARGTAEAAVTAWLPSVEQNVRSEVVGATMENIRQKLAIVSRYSYLRSDLQKEGVWKTAVDAEMTPAQRAAWQVERDARSRYRAASTAAWVLAEFDRKFSLLPEQWDKLATLLTRVMQDYQPDIDHSMYFFNTPWYLSSYYTFLPLHALPETDLKALLQPEQWKRWSGGQEYSLTAGFWDRVRQAREQRLKQKEP